MPDARMRADSIKLDVDGMNIDVKNAQRGNDELNNALSNPKEYVQFVKDPKSFASKYNFEINDQVATHLKEALSGTVRLEEAYGRIVGGTNPADLVGATVWAVAEGAYSFATSKVAVAFRGSALSDRVNELNQLQSLGATLGRLSKPGR